VEGTPAEDSARIGYLNNLGTALRARFDHTGVRADLDWAVDVSEQATEAIPAGHAQRALVLSNHTGRGFDAAGLAQTQSEQVATAEHGRGLQIIDALAENLQITNRREHGAMIRFEKTLTPVSELHA
jgi:hypothetical protein